MSLTPITTAVETPEKVFIESHRVYVGDVETPITFTYENILLSMRESLMRESLHGIDIDDELTRMILQELEIFCKNEGIDIDTLDIEQFKDHIACLASE